MHFKRSTLSLALVACFAAPAPAPAVGLNFTGDTDRWDQGTNWYACTIVIDCFPGAYGTPDFGDTVTFARFTTAVIYKGKVGEASRVEVNNNATLQLSPDLVPGDFQGKDAKLTVRGDMVVGYKGSLGTVFNEFGQIDVTTLTLGHAAGDTGLYRAGSDPGARFGTLQATTAYIGLSGSADYIQHSNSRTIISGDLSIGHHSTSQSASFKHYGGVVSANNEYIGKGGFGTFTQKDSEAYSSHTVSNDLVLGRDEGARGEYYFRGGVLTARYETVGELGSGYFEHSGGTHTAETLTLGSNAKGLGTYDLGLYGTSPTLLVKDDETIGSYGKGTFIQRAGTHDILGKLFLGRYEGGEGQFHLTGGTLTAKDEYIGYGPGATGTFKQSGGTHNAQLLRLGLYQPGSSGTYTLSGGELKVVQIAGGRGGSVGSSVFNLDNNGLSFYGNGADNDLINVGSFNMGSAAGSHGSFALATAGKAVQATTMNVGYAGKGSYSQSLDTSTSVTGTLYVGHLAGSDGSVTLSGSGSLNASGEVIGFYGRGEFVQSGGVNTTGTGGLVLGLYAGSTGSYELSGTGVLNTSVEHVGLLGSGSFKQSGGTHTVTTLYMGYLAGGQGSYTLSGGTLNVNRIGNGPGTSTFTLDGGQLNLAGATMDVDVFAMAVAERSVASFELRSGQTLTATQGTAIGTGGIASFTQSGGTHQANGLGLQLGSDQGDSQGQYSLNDGILNSSQATIGTDGRYGAGHFVQNGGTHTVGPLAGGAGLVIGATGSYSQNGGELNVNNRLANNGQLLLAGGTTRVNGPTSNAAGGQIEIANETVFSADVVNHGRVQLSDADVTVVGGYTEHGRFVSDQSAIRFLGDLVVHESGYLAAGAEDSFRIAGHFQNLSQQAALWDTSAATLRFEGTGLHEFSLAGTDLGNGANGHLSNFAWGALSLEGDSILSLIDGNALPGAALYVGEFTLLNGIGQLADIQSAFNIYYNPILAGNAYLGGQSYALAGGGSLIAAAVPEPETWALMLVGLGLLSRRVAGDRARRRA
jgi:hypothetical protein